MLLLAMSVKLTAEIALMAMLGQVLLGWLAGAARETNVFWRLLEIVTLPPRQLVRCLGGRRWAPRQQRWAAAGLMLGLWLASTLAKVLWCMRLGVMACR